ncbi:hypothetical protein MD484_g8577, partial [Candolleomyces efflorescens]
MGFTGLARWINADADSLAKVEHNIRVNHNGVIQSRWLLSLKSYRSTFNNNPSNPNPGGFVSPERSIVTVTMNDVVFVLLEDQIAPTHVEAEEQGMNPEKLTHFRNTFLTVRPPGSLENLLVMLKARWMPVRHAAGTTQNASLISVVSGAGAPGGGSGKGKGPAGTTPNNPLAAAELIVDGKVFHIGLDWILRVGLVRSKDLIKGMLLEAEYRPLPVMYSPPGAQGTMISNFLSSILPVVPDANIYAVTVGEEQWADLLWDREEEQRKKEEKEREEEEKEKEKKQLGTDASENDDDIYVYGFEDVLDDPKRDWEGIDRDRRSAYQVIGALKAENIL